MSKSYYDKYAELEEFLTCGQTTMDDVENAYKDEYYNFVASVYDFLYGFSKEELISLSEEEAEAKWIEYMNENHKDYIIQDC